MVSGKFLKETNLKNPEKYCSLRDVSDIPFVDTGMYGTHE